MSPPWLFARGELLRRHLYNNDMNMKTVNVTLTRTSTQTQEESVEGEWYTELEFRVQKKDIWSKRGSKRLKSPVDLPGK